METYPTFSHLTTPVNSDDLPPLNLEPSLAPALPQLVEPDLMPNAPLRDIAGWLRTVDDIPGVIDLNAYGDAELPGALQCSLVRVGVADRLAAVVEALPGSYGLAVFDGWRPLDLQETLYERAYADPTLPPGFVSVPSLDPRTPPPHLTGGTVDLTLTWNSWPLALGTDFDDFTAAAHTAAFKETPSKVRDHRRMLVSAMRAAGFVVLDCEWWHFEFGTRRWAALTGNTPLYAAMYEDIASVAG